MSVARFGEVDHDLLADYVGGALDGTAEADAVAERVAGDPAWAQAHEKLVAALDAVQSDLAAFAAAAEPMPADVAARVEAALSEAARPQLTVLPGGRGDGAGGRADVAIDRARRPRSSRWIRWAGGGAAAAGLLVAAGFGLNALVVTGSASDNAGSTAAGAPAPMRADSGGAGESQRDSGGEIAKADPPVVASGVDYGRSTLARAAGLRAPAAAGGTASPAPTGSSAPLLSPALPSQLTRFADRRQLRDCETAILRARGGGGFIQVMDLASFEGRPAVVAVVVGPDNGKTAWVSGPECGTPAGGADTIYTTVVP